VASRPLFPSILSTTEASFQAASFGHFLLPLNSIFRPSASLEQLLCTPSWGLSFYSLISFSKQFPGSLSLGHFLLPLSIIIEQLLGTLSHILSFNHLTALWKQLYRLASSRSFSSTGCNHFIYSRAACSLDAFLYQSVDWNFFFFG
jgi:hypothetical protein